MGGGVKDKVQSCEILAIQILQNSKQGDWHVLVVNK